MDYKAIYESWLENPYFDEDTKAELRAIADDENEIKERFYMDLEFGTAGLRGVLGAGTNRMNVYVIRRATQAVAQYLNETDLPKTVAIGHDSRIKSDVFAREAAAVFAANGITAYLYPRLEPVPALSFAVRHLHCGLGVCVTASHNPAEYNGYKVYGADGCQMTPEAAKRVVALLEHMDYFASAKTMDFDAALAAGSIRYIPDGVLDAFVDAVYAQRVGSGEGIANLKLVYTPLNGAGLECVKKLTQKLGIRNMTIVKEQEQPDGHFPTCPYPNPEIRQAMTEGVGRDIRDSQTMGYETYYYAVLLPNGEILRMAQDAETVWSIYDSTLPAIVLSCVALMLAAAVLAALLTRALVSPVLSMTEDLDHIQDNVPYKELVPFAESIHSDRILRENNEKMRQEFTANVSHELKTPLTSISGYAELIETGIAKPEDVPGFAQKIHVEASRMIQLVNDILQLSSLDNASEAGSEPEMETVDLLTVAKDCVERQKLNARRAYISLNCLGESALVHGNRALLDELCQNLCDNAIRYNRPGGKVQITTACSRDGHCTLTVADNGIGIPKEAQSSVFERFYRVDKSRSKATGGTGLGLAIVKHIARIHNARIKLESQVDVGTTITVTFPTAN